MSLTPETHIYELGDTGVKIKLEKDEDGAVFLFFANDDSVLLSPGHPADRPQILALFGPHSLAEPEPVVKQGKAKRVTP